MPRVFVARRAGNMQTNPLLPSDNELELGKILRTRLQAQDSRELAARPTPGKPASAV